ncbi:MAG: glycosyltransferase family 4 protein [Chitinophagales bacterium]|nr:glycosyltransferase family 4 protein [Chitinophagales bacterium]
MNRKKIAVNTRFLLKNKLEGIGWFSYETLKRMVIAHPEFDFYFIFDRPYDESFIFSKNVFPIVIGPPARHPFLWYIWFEFSMTKCLKEIQPDLFFSPDGYLSLRAKCPQHIVIHDLAFEHYPLFVPFWARKFYQYFTPKYASKARRIATVSNYTKRDISALYGVDLSKIDVVFNGANELYRPLNETEREKTKCEFSDGKKYFIFNGAIHPRKNLKNVFLAFDLYKAKWGSDCKLIVAGRKAWHFTDIFETYESMHYKGDVVFTGHVSQDILYRLMASAEALLYVSIFEGFGIPIIEAMQCGTPVISSNTTATAETSGEAAIKVSPEDIDFIAQAMHSLIENPAMRKEYIQKGLEHAKNYSWDITASKLWDSINKCL